MYLLVWHSGKNCRLQSEDESSNRNLRSTDHSGKSFISVVKKKINPVSTGKLNKPLSQSRSGFTIKNKNII